MSSGLMSIALLNPALTVHTVTIAVADTGDHILDTGMFINNFTVENATSGGVKLIIPATPGNDLIGGGLGAEYCELDSGDDSMSAGGGDDIVKGNNGNDTIAGGDGFDQITGDAGADLLIGNLNGDTIQGGLGPDTLQGGNGLDLLQGGNGFDHLVGALGADTLVGGAGGDNLTGAGGNDSLVGGAGTDVFVFDSGSGVDQITDFAPVDDTISVRALINGSGLDTALEFYDPLTDDGLGNTVLDLGLAGNSVTLAGVTKAQLSEADFAIF
jgi:Ca2+-binding RTX toxin-like protein